jgi:hypothetical protein
VTFLADCFYAAPIDRLAWKHSLQKTGRPCVGLKGTVVSLPHCEQVVFVSDRICPPPALLPDSARLALQALQRFGSFLNPLSAKNICSPAVKTNSAPHSEHFRTLSWNSMAASPLDPFRAVGRTDHSFTMGHYKIEERTRGTPSTEPLGRRAKNLNEFPTTLPDWGLIPEVRRRAASRTERLILFATLLLAQSLPRKRFFRPALFAGLHVEAVLLYFLDYVFLLHFALKTTQCILKRLILLNDDLCQ